MDARERYAKEMQATVERVLAGRFNGTRSFNERAHFQSLVADAREIDDELLLSDIENERELVADGHSAAHPYMLAAAIVVARERGLTID